MVFRFMRAITLNAFGTLDMTCECGVTPPPAIFALRYARVYSCSPDSSDVVAYIKISVDEKFSVMAALNIPNVDPDYGYIRLGGYFDNSQLGREGNVIKNVVLF